MLRAGATLLTAGAVALAGLTPAQAAEEAAEASPRLSFTCSTGKGTKTFTATFDSDAPVQMHVGDPAASIKLSTTLTLPNSGYVSSYWWAAKRKVSGPLEFNALIGDGPVRSTLALAHTPADAWFGEGASWTIGGEGALGSLSPTTAGDVAGRGGGVGGGPPLARGDAALVGHDAQGQGDAGDPRPAGTALGGELLDHGRAGGVPESGHGRRHLLPSAASISSAARGPHSPAR